MATLKSQSVKKKRYHSGQENGVFWEEGNDEQRDVINNKIKNNWKLFWFFFFFGLSAWLLLLLLSRFSRVRLLVTPWTAAYQAPLSMGFSRQEYWSGVPLDLIPGPGIELVPSAVEAWSDNHWATKEVPKTMLIHNIYYRNWIINWWFPNWGLHQYYD